MPPRNRENGQFEKTHGLTNTRLYSIWSGMKNRCLNPKKREYAKYGAVGIDICVEWENDFMAFYEWAINHGYNDDLSIDRIDNTKGYSPENCRWADRLTQTTNRRITKFVDIDGEKLTVPEISRRYGIDKYCLYSRARKLGYVKEILNEKPIKKYQYQGNEYTLTELAKHIGISTQTLLYRIQHGWKIEDWNKAIKS